MPIVRMKKPKAVVMDIEGTTTSTTFIREKLFPYISSNLKQYIRNNWKNEGLQVTIVKLREQQQRDLQEGLEAPEILKNGSESDIIESVANNVMWQMANKRKNTALKQLQILVWVDGYEQNKLKGHVFDDVPPALNYWKNNLELQLYIFSQGMSVAQNLLFSCSTHGNLQPLFDNFFDANVGLKTNPESYKQIAATIKLNTSDIVFLTDTPKEARAAVKAGCKAILLDRPGNKPISSADRKEFPVVQAFGDIDFTS